ncbi:retrovirus-related pol polyprotein from transposon TNT 1-94 [Tanacetum coccineum]
MSTSTTHQQSLANVGSETRPLMLERGSYIPWASRFRRYLNRKRENRNWLNKEIDEGPYVFKNFTPEGSQTPTLQTKDDLTGDYLKHYEAMSLILISIPNDICNSVDTCTTAQAIWQRVERLMRGTVQNKVDRETHFNYEFDQFIVEPGEALIAKKLEKSHDPLALVAHTGSSSRIPSPFYVTHPSSVADYDDDYQGGAFQNNFEDPLISAMMLLARAITQQEIIESNNVQNDVGNIQRSLRTTSSGSATNVQCYNCSKKGHYACNFPKPKVQDSKNFMEQMWLAKQDEAGVTLTDEQK